jgi:hypothetical protein
MDSIRRNANVILLTFSKLFMENYEHLAMDEVYDILLYNPDIDDIVKTNLVDNLLEYYTDIEDYQKCQHLQELKLVMEKKNETNNKKNK